MNRLSILTVICFFITLNFIIAQPGPGDWQDAIETTIQGSNFDAETNELGYHLVLDTGSELHYYLIGNDGQVHLDNTIVSGGGSPAVATYGANAYVVYAKNNQIQGQKGTFTFDSVTGEISVTWSAVLTNPHFTGTAT